MSKCQCFEFLIRFLNMTDLVLNRKPYLSGINRYSSTKTRSIYSIFWRILVLLNY